MLKYQTFLKKQGVLFMAKKVFGLKGINILPLLTDNETGHTYETDLMQVHGAQEFSLSVLSESFELFGDDRILAKEAVMLGFEFEFKNALIDLRTLQALEGGTVADVMSTDATPVKIGESYENKSGDVNFPYFGLIARSLKDGKDWKVVLHKCTVEGIEFSMVNKDFAIASGKGTAIARDHDGMMRKILALDVVQAPAITDFD
jgi:hypothetical protein